MFGYPESDVWAWLGRPQSGTACVVDARIVFVASDTALFLQFYERHAQVCTFQFGRPFYLVKCVAVHPIHQGVHPTAVSFDNFHVEHTLHVFSGYYF